MPTMKSLRSTAALAAGLVSAACATFSPAAPDVVVQQGVAELAGGRYESALAVFQAAADGLTPNGVAVFYEGVTLNRLGRFAEAVERFDRAAAMGVDHPELGFETGLALVSLRRWDEAIDRLERYEQMRPGRGKTSELLGRAYLAAWQPERAERKLKEAMARDPALAPGAFFYLAVLERSRNDAEAVRSYVLALLASASDARLTSVVPQTAAPAAPAVPARSAARYVKTPLANVREAPSTASKVVTVLKRGTPLSVLGEDPGWYRIALGDRQQGWIAASVTAGEIRSAPAPAVAEAPRPLAVVGVESAVSRFALDPNPALLVRFDAQTAPPPTVEDDVSALHLLSERIRELLSRGAASEPPP
jgi:tetratricopeptide (TPR) repeat protein